MAKKKETIKSEIKAFIKSVGGSYSSWYVGIATHPRTRLFSDHNVTENWIYREAMSSASAREIEEYFIEKLGTDGGSGGGDKSTKYVYAYKKTSETKE